MGKEIFLHRLNTSTRLYSQKEGDMQKVTIRYAVSSPLVEHRGKETIPLFNEEICLSKQYERLQKVSNSLHGL